MVAWRITGRGGYPHRVRVRAPDPDHFRAYSPQIADDHRLQPDTAANDLAFTASRRHVARHSDQAVIVEIA